MSHSGCGISLKLVTSCLAWWTSVQSRTYTLMTLPNTRNATSSPDSAPGRWHSDWPAGPILVKCGQHRVRVSLSARQAKAMDLLTSGTYGLPCSTSSSSIALQAFLENRLRAKTLALGSTLYKLTWKSWITPSGRSRFRLRASVPRTSGIASTGWPTPTTADSSGGGQAKRAMGETRHGSNLNDFVMLLSGWPTTTTTDSLRVPSMEFTTANITLNHAALFVGWRTPTCQSPNSLRGNGQDPARRSAQGHTINLTDEVNWLKNNPQPCRLTATGETLIGSLAAMGSSGQLDPAHSRWLMGLPPEWDDCAPTETQSTLNKRKFSSKSHSNARHDDEL